MDNIPTSKYHHKQIVLLQISFDYYCRSDELKPILLNETVTKLAFHKSLGFSVFDFQHSTKMKVKDCK